MIKIIVAAHPDAERREAGSGGRSTMCGTLM